MLDYPAEVQSYTGGRGRLALRLEGYYPCHNQEEVLADIGYDSEEDVDNPSGSIFCSHGAGFFVPWDQVPDYMHIKEKIPDITDSADGDEANAFVRGKNEIMEEKKDARDSGVTYASSYIEDKELEAIFLREFGSKKQQEGPLPGIPENIWPGSGYIRKPKLIGKRNFQILRRRRNAVRQERGKAIPSGGRLQYHIRLGFSERAGGGESGGCPGQADGYPL